MNKEEKEYMNFEKYKDIATKNDIKELEQIYKPKVLENFPLIGTTVYGWRMLIAISGIDRGPLRKEIMKQKTKFMFMFLLYFFLCFTILTPWFTYWYINIAIKNTKQLVEEKDI